MRVWALIAILLAFFVVTLGAYTRLTDAGLGCPDWPGCYGFLTVPDQEAYQKTQDTFAHRPLEVEKAWNEMIHRYFAGSLGLLIFALTFFAWRQSKQNSHKFAVAAQNSPLKLLLVLSGLIIFQAALGMWTVTMNLMPVVVMGHLLGGFTIFCLLVLLYQISTPNEAFFGQVNQAAVSPALFGFSCLVLLLLVIQIALGGWTSANYAAMVCTQLPICEPGWQQGFSSDNFKQAFSLLSPKAESYEFGVLDYHPRVAIHVSHRFGAVVASIAILSLLVWSWRQVKALRGQVFLVAVLLFTQVALGISNILFSLPLLNAVAHNAVGLLLLSSVLVLSYQLRLRMFHQPDFTSPNNKFANAIES